jgi:hypothetical protein
VNPRSRRPSPAWPTSPTNSTTVAPIRRVGSPPTSFPHRPGREPAVRCASGWRSTASGPRPPCAGRNSTSSRSSSPFLSGVAPPHARLEPAGLRGPVCLAPRRRHRRYEPATALRRSSTVCHTPVAHGRQSRTNLKSAIASVRGGLPPSDSFSGAFPMNHSPCRVLLPAILLRARRHRVRRSPFSLEPRLLPGLSDAVASAAKTIKGGSRGATLDLPAIRVVRLPFQVRATPRCAPTLRLPAAGLLVPTVNLQKVPRLPCATAWPCPSPRSRCALCRA